MSATQQLYLMENSTGLFKIGISQSPERRLSQIKNASGLTVKLLAVWDTEEDARTVEQRLHKKFKDKRKHGEWFEGLSVEVIEDSEELYPVEETTKLQATQKPKKVAFKKIKCTQLNCNTTPICELVLQNKIESSMKSIITDKVELDMLAKEQELIATTLLKLKYNRAKHKEWMDNLCDNNTIFHPHRMHYTASKIYKPLTLNCVHGCEFYSSISFPWVNTLEGAKALTAVRVKEWLDDIKKGEDQFYEEINSVEFK